MNKKILIVEDEKMLAEMYKDKLDRSGFEAYIAFDAEEGFKLIKKTRPDLILLDILLPKENGISLLGRIRNDSEISPTPVIAFSNYDSRKTKEEAYNFNVKEYLIKTDYTPQELLEVIKKYVN